MDLSDIETLGEGLERLEGSLQASAEMTDAFDAGLQNMREGMAVTERMFGKVERTLSGDLSRGFVDVIMNGARLSDVLRDVARSMIETTLQSSFQPIADGLAGLVTNGIQNLFAFENGGVMSSGRVSAFAKGGVVDQPTFFPMRSGVGLMGEAGPEAIMPLSKGADGRLGVRAEASGQPINIVMHIQTPDVQGFQQSRGQIAAGLSRALARGRNTL